MNVSSDQHEMIDKKGKDTTKFRSIRLTSFSGKLFHSFIYVYIKIYYKYLTNKILP